MWGTQWQLISQVIFVDAQGAPLGVTDKRVAELTLGNNIRDQRAVHRSTSYRAYCVFGKAS